MMYLSYFIFFAIIIVVETYEPLNCTTRSHSEELFCGTRGNATRGREAPLGPFHVQSFERCRDFALKTPMAENDPSNLLFDPDKSLCMLDTYTYKRKFVKDKHGHYLYYDADCFRCQPQPCTLGNNVILNGGFEYPTDINPPWLSNRTIGGYKSEHATVRLEQPTFFHSSCSSNHSEPPSLFKLGFYYKRIGKTTKKNAELISYDFEYNGYPNNRLAVWDTQDEWIRFEALKTLPKKDDTILYRPPSYHHARTLALDVYSAYYTDFSLLLDDVVLYPVETDKAETPKPGAVSILTNGGFEDGLAPWTVNKTLKSSNITVVNRGINSAHALFLGTKSKRSSEFNLQQIMPIEHLTQYLFSFNIMVNLRGQDQYGDSYLYITLTMNSEGREAYVYFEPWDIIRQKGTHRIAIPLIAVGDTLRVEIDIVSEKGQDFLLDNFEVVEAVGGT